MARVSSYSDRRPVLKAEGPEAPDIILGTVMVADLYRQGTLAGIELYEHPGRVVWARGRELQALAEALGPETDDWPHGAIVLEKVRRNNPRTGGHVDKYVVAPLDRWDELRGKAAPAKLEGTRRALRPRQGGAELHYGRPTGQRWDRARTGPRTRTVARGATVEV